eukprot:488588_1
MGSCLTSDNSIKYNSIRLSNEEENNIIDEYQRQRRFVSVKSEEEMKYDTSSTVTIMTYNILADGTTYALSSHHEYCDIQYRNWQHRGPRILLKFKAYNPDIICMQEITLTLYNEYFKSEMKKLGYIGVYGRRNNASDEIQDDCIWIKTDKIKIIKSKVIRLGNPSKQDSNHKNNFICESDEIRDLGRNKNCYFFRQLENCWDVFIVVFCQLKS